MKMIDTINKFNICIVTLPFADPVGATLLSNFIDILEPLSNELFAITGEFPDRQNKRIHIIRIKSDDKKELTLIRAIKYIFKQLRTTFNLIKISKHIGIVIFFIGTSVDVLPILFSKLLGKKAIIVVTGLESHIVKSDTKRLFGFGKIIFPFIFANLERINYTLSDQIVVDPQNIYVLGLQRYKNKIAYMPRHVDLDRFKVSKKVDRRENIVGYIGRLSEEKGIRNFADAIPIILKNCENVKFLIGGGGALFKEVEQKLERTPQNKILFTNWISHEKLPEYLNELKLLVIPSYTETGPFIALEAMACGTPILATPVGLIPDIVKDEETGFIMENNSPECIAENVIRVLNYPDLDKIAKNARELVEKDFTYEGAVERYGKIL
jgi:glycosyltransferase involved in cell wall biosynthesis